MIRIWLKKKKEKGRVFFISDFMSYLITKPFIAPLLSGCGTQYHNSPIAIGMYYDKGGCTDFLIDLFGLTDLMISTYNTPELFCRWTLIYDELAFGQVYCES
jgi:hypothetical protein